MECRLLCVLILQPSFELTSIILLPGISSNNMDLMIKELIWFHPTDLFFRLDLMSDCVALLYYGLDMCSILDLSKDANACNLVAW